MPKKLQKKIQKKSTKKFQEITKKLTKKSQKFSETAKNFKTNQIIPTNIQQTSKKHSKK